MKKPIHLTTIYEGFFFFLVLVNENSDINQMTIVLIPFVALFASLMEMGA